MSTSTRRLRLWPGAFLIAAAVAFLPTAAFAQPGNLAVGLMVGIGGSVDESETEIDNLDLQAVLLYDLDRNTLVSVRLGQLQLDTNRPSPLDGSDLTYLTVAGEYRFTGSIGESGVFLGLGLYSLDGSNPLLEDDTGLGLTLGVTGDFRINERFSVLAEVSGHYADLSRTQTFVMILGGVAYHF